MPVPNLDDRSFQDIVDQAKRLIPKYCPEWTNHNLSDPGVALIEVFAWMTELTLFRINQIPDRFYAKFLELVGIEPFPAVPATTELIFWLSAIDVEPVLVPTGTQVSTQRAGERSPVVFMTEDDLTIAQPRLMACVTATVEGQVEDRWDDLMYEGSTVRCFASAPVAAGDSVNFGFADTLAGNVLRLEIDASAEGLGIDPEVPPLLWEAWAGEDWAPARIVSDETGGLNRPGAITLVLPGKHEPLTLGNIEAFWLRASLVATGESQPTYRTSPELARLRSSTLGGAVLARHGEPMPSEVLGRSDGTPAQEFTVRRAPILERRPGEGVRILTEAGATDWEEVADFADSTPDDLHYTWDGTSGRVQFGPEIRYPDGSTRQHGAIPPKGAEVLVTGYRVGGGAVGNVGAGTLTVLNSTIPFIDRVENLTSAVGGLDAESYANAKLRGPLTLRTGQRAVTAGDFERLTLESSTEVARARCLDPVAPGKPLRLLLVPRVHSPVRRLRLDDFALTEPLVQQVSGFLDERRILGTSVEIGTPYYQGVTVAARVLGASDRNASLVRQRALDVLYAYLNPLNGGDNGTGWPFEGDLTAGMVAQVLSSVDGVDRVLEVLLFEADLRLERRVGVAKDHIELEENGLLMSFQHQVVVQ